MASASGDQVEALVANATDAPMVFELPGAGTAELLTQESFSSSGGWGAAVPLTGSLVVPAGAIARIRQV
jgi:hypothetical protein